MVQWAPEKNKLFIMKTRKPLGELYSGEKFDPEKELNKPTEKETGKVSEFRIDIQTHEKNLQHLHKVLRDYLDSVPDIKKLMAKEDWELMAENYRGDQKHLQELVDMRARLEQLNTDEIPQKMQELIRRIKEEETALKALQDLLLDENWHEPGIGEA